MNLQCCRKFSVPFPRSVPQYDPVSEFYRQFLGLHGLVCALTCTVNCGTLYRQVCAFPNHVQSTEFKFQSSCRNISRMISGNRMHLSSILSVMAKTVNTYVHVIFSFFIICKDFKQTSFTLSLWGIVCRILRKIMNLIHFGIRL